MMTQECKQTSTGPCCADLRERLDIPVLRALADPSRVAIVVSLAEAGTPLRVTEVGTCCPQDISVVSRHLAHLRAAGVVESERRGREVWYSLRTEALSRMLRELADALEHCGPAAQLNQEEES
jgi:ArsR family transcriptional regulator